MAKVYDIVERLKEGNKKPTVKIDEDHVYEISNSKNSALFIKGITEDKKIDDMERLDKIVEAGLGKEAKNYINSLELSMPAYNTIVNVIMAAISDMTLEEIEEIGEKEIKKFRK